MCAGVEKKKQEANEAHSLFRQKSAEKRLQSRTCHSHSAIGKRVGLNFERAVGCSSLTAGKQVESEKSECKL